jgi:hypothetical protein
MDQTLGTLCKVFITPSSEAGSRSLQAAPCWDPYHARTLLSELCQRCGRTWAYEYLPQPFKHQLVVARFGPVHRFSVEASDLVYRLHADVADALRAASEKE